MKIATLVSAIITTLLILTNMICGFWLRANNITAQSSFNFHMICGILAVVFSILTVVMLVIFFKHT